VDEVLLHGIELMGLPHWAEVYQSLGRPSIRIKTFTFEGEAPIGVSKFGGSPDLPSNILWPTYSGHALPFVAQVLLSEAVRFDNADILPKSGMLYFFYDIINTPGGYDLEEQAWRVMFVDAESDSLHRVASPCDLIDPFTQEAARLLTCGMSFSSEVTYPCWTSPDCVATFFHEDQYRYEQILDYEVQKAMTRSSSTLTITHRIGGYPDVLQPTDMPSEADLLSKGIFPYQDGVLLQDVDVNRDAWTLLLQVDSDGENSDMFWGDSGRIYFWIKKQDLATKNFNNVWLLLQSL
jgi:uncharacterized protein YwqG